MNTTEILQQTALREALSALQAVINTANDGVLIKPSNRTYRLVCDAIVALNVGTT